MTALKDSLKEIWLLKEGAIIGLVIGLVLYFLNVQPVLIFIQTWFGPFGGTQLLVTTLFITVSLGIIIDAIYKPNK
jgi:hypothetical protein